MGKWMVEAYDRESGVLLGRVGNIFDNEEIATNYALSLSNMEGFDHSRAGDTVDYRVVEHSGEKWMVEAYDRESGEMLGHTGTHFTSKEEANAYAVRKLAEIKLWDGAAAAARIEYKIVGPFGGDSTK